MIRRLKNLSVPVSTIIIVGHPLSNYEEVETLLTEHGMQSAFHSQQHSMLPIEINAALLKSCQQDPVATFHDPKPITQIKPEAMWQGLALDLFLNNMEHKLWGWADPQTVYLLDYWQKQNSRIGFIFLFDSLNSTIFRLIKNHGTTLSVESIQSAIQNWQIYNQALLNFYYRTTNPSLLAHSKQVTKNTKDYLQKIKIQMGVPVAIEIDTHRKSSEPLNDTEKNSANQNTVSNHQRTTGNDTDQLYAHLIQLLVEEHPDALELYEELQSVADFPIDNETDKNNSKSTKILALSSIESNIKQLLIEAELHKKKEGELIKTIEILMMENTNKPSSPDLLEENQLLKIQLHLAQEELENYHLKSWLKKEPPPTPVSTQKEDKKNIYFGAGNRIKKQLSYRLGAILITNSKTFTGVVIMPFTLTKEVWKFRKERSTLPIEKLPPIYLYKDAHDADRIKKHLSYRLGKTLIDNSRSPLNWLKIPFKLKHEFKKYKQDQEQRKSVCTENPAEIKHEN